MCFRWTNSLSSTTHTSNERSDNSYGDVAGSGQKDTAANSEGGCRSAECTTKTPSSPFFGKTTATATGRTTATAPNTINHHLHVTASRSLTTG